MSEPTACCEANHRGIGHGGHECKSQRIDPQSWLPWYCTRPDRHEGRHEAWGADPDALLRYWTTDDKMALKGSGGPMTDLRADLIEAGADAVVGLPYDTLELRNWGEESVADPYRIVSQACLDTFLTTLADRADEWERAGWEFPALGNIERLVAVLRGDE